MNPINHFIFAISLCLTFVELNFVNIVFVVLFSLIFGILIDYDHIFNKKAHWYHKRTWIQEPFVFVLIGLTLAAILSLVKKIFFILVIVPFLGHIFLDYLCVHEACPLAPFSKIKKKEGLGIFISDNLFVRSQNSKKWAERVKARNIEGVSENYFTLFNLVLLIIILLFKLNIF